jgi:hypothetical protein
LTKGSFSDRFSSLVVDNFPHPSRRSVNVISIQKIDSHTAIISTGMPVVRPLPDVGALLLYVPKLILKSVGYVLLLLGALGLISCVMGVLAYLLL